MTTISPAPADELRRQLARDLARTGVLTSPAWKAAFATVPREIFAPVFAIHTPAGSRAYTASDPAWLNAVYSDQSLLTLFDENGVAISSSSQPTLMARMLEQLDLSDGHRVLEIGTGTGYNAALLSERVGSANVTTVDIDPDLTATAQARLAQAGYTPTVITGDGLAGWPAGAPYDALLATCGVPRVPAAWLSQVAPCGVIVANLGLGIAALTVQPDGSARGRFLPTPAAFMTARPASDAPAPGGQARRAINAEPDRERSHALGVDLSGFGPQFLGHLLQPEVETITLLADGTPKLVLFDPSSDSWARISASRVEWAGPRDLWKEREPLISAWVGMGEPGPDRYSLRVTAAGEHALAAAGCEWRLP